MAVADTRWLLHRCVPDREGAAKLKTFWSRRLGRETFTWTRRRRAHATAIGDSIVMVSDAMSGRCPRCSSSWNIDRPRRAVQQARVREEPRTSFGATRRRGEGPSAILVDRDARGGRFTEK
jgi:hypothetical protein